MKDLIPLNILKLKMTKENEIKEDISNIIENNEDELTNIINKFFGGRKSQKERIAKLIMLEKATEQLKQELVNEKGYKELYEVLYNMFDISNKN